MFVDVVDDGRENCGSARIDVVEKYVCASFSVFFATNHNQEKMSKQSRSFFLDLKRG
jgi:hypothetical protein